MSKLTMRFIAAWIVLQAVAAFFQLDDRRLTIGTGVVGLAAAFLVFVDSTSYRSVRKATDGDRP